MIKITISADTQREAEQMEAQAVKIIQAERIRRPEPDKGKRHHIYITGRIKSGISP